MNCLPYDPPCNCSAVRPLSISHTSLYTPMHCDSHETLAFDPNALEDALICNVAVIISARPGTCIKILDPSSIPESKASSPRLSAVTTKPNAASICINIHMVVMQDSTPENLSSKFRGSFRPSNSFLFWLKILSCHGSQDCSRTRRKVDLRP